MSELQLWLIVVGIVSIGAVFIFNKIQEARLKRRTEAAFKREDVDALMNEIPGSDPSIQADHPRGDDAGMPDEADWESRVRRIEHTIGLPQETDFHTVSGPLHDPRFDFIAVIMFPEERSGEAILRHAASIFRDAERPAVWEGLTAVGQGWEEVSPRQKYGAVRVGLQLVDRRGKATDGALNEFCARVQELTATLPGQATFPGRAEALRLAEHLDRFCSEVDVQIGFNLVKPDGGVIPGARIRAAAKDAACTLDSDGRFRRRSQTGAELYAISNLEPTPFSDGTLDRMITRGLTVSMDVPRAPGTEEAYSALQELTATLARSLEARLVDDNRQPIPPPALEAIARRVATIRERMRAEGIEPGSPLALRLFS